MRLADSHAHLTSKKYESNLSEILTTATNTGVKLIINVACDFETSLAAIHQAEQNPILFPTVGIQPHDASTFTIDSCASLKKIAMENSKVVAIGEIGLDGFHKLSPMNAQIECFEAFLAVALDLKLPVIVHMRETFKEVFAALEPFAKKGGCGVMHCFTGTLAEARTFLDLGFYISFSGILTFKNSSELVEVAKFIPENRLLIETDCPYLAPVPLRGKTNEPAFVKHVCEYLATIRKQPLEDVANLTFENTKSLFSKIPHFT